MDQQDEATPNPISRKTSREATATSHLPLRTWPLPLLIGTMVTLRLLPLALSDSPEWLPLTGAMGPIVCALIILLWWLFASRALVKERILGLTGLILIGGLCFLAADPTMQGPASLFIWTIPLGIATFGMGAKIARHYGVYKRTLTALSVAVVGFGLSTLVRTDGMWGHAQMDLYWRWTPTAEETLLATTSTSSRSEAATSDSQTGTNLDALEHALNNPEWPGFRGPNRNSRQTGTFLEPDWNVHPPEQLWRISVGPAWSSFAVAGDYLFTQEQRGPNECAVCYDSQTGEQRWLSQIENRFNDPIGGPGPRATPELVEGSLYVQGAAGDLLRLDARTGAIRWQTNIGEHADREPPTWGYSSSPLVIGSVVVVHAGGPDSKGTLAFDRDTGALAWTAPGGDHSYASPQAVTLEGEQVVIMLTNAGLNLLDITSGEVGLSYEWPHTGYRALQPQLVNGNAVLLATERATGTRQLRITRNEGAWTAEEIWTTRHMKADFNDFVVFEDHIYGFDGGLFACVGLDKGDRKWKGGRYGNGQVLLLEDSGLLLVTTERGDGVLLEATPEDHVERARIPLLEGKTWNHPVVVGDRLYVRNAQEAACYRLPTVAMPEKG